MNTNRHAQEDLSAAACPLIAYSALFGVSGFLMAIVAVALWPPDTFAIWALAIPLSASAILAVIAWGIQMGKPWAWFPAVCVSAILATAFPVGTLISYCALSALWRLKNPSLPDPANSME